MITTKTELTNGNRKFGVTFDCNPSDITGHSVYGNCTHKAGWHNTRNGIGEGIVVTTIKYKGEDGVWREWKPADPNNKVVYLETSKNGVELGVEATYEIWTMGFPGRTYPFFYFGNFNNDPNRYMSGHFNDSKPVNPSPEKNKFTSVPDDWTLTYLGWVEKGGNRHEHSWCYQNTRKGQNHWDDRGFEQNVHQGKELGWTSYGANSKWTQFSRHHCYWIYTKTYKTWVNSQGVIMNPGAPELTVIPAKGDKGRVTIVNRNDEPQYYRIDCKNMRTNAISTVVDFSNDYIKRGESKTIEVDFFKAFGESGRAADLYYYAWFKDSQGHSSNSNMNSATIPNTEWKGTHRYNGRPTIPTGLFVKGRDNIYYDNITASWNASTDPDGDEISYKVHLEVMEGQSVIKNEVIATTKDRTINYDIGPFPEGSKCKVSVCATDGLLDSAYTQAFAFAKGSAARKASTVYPINNSTIYNKNTRLLVDLGGQLDVNVKIKHGDRSFDSKTDTANFSIYQGKCIFKFPYKISPSTTKVSVQISNAYGDSEPLILTYSMANNPYNQSTLDPDVIISGDQLQNIRKMINNIRNAYGYESIKYTNEPDTFIYATDYIETYSAILEVNDFINDFVATSNFDYGIRQIEVAKDVIIDDIQWDELVKAIDNV